MSQGGTDGTAHTAPADVHRPDKAERAALRYGEQRQHSAATGMDTLLRQVRAILRRQHTTEEDFFKSLDADGGGTVTRGEFLDGLGHLLGLSGEGMGHQGVMTDDAALQVRIGRRGAGLGYSGLCVVLYLHVASSVVRVVLRLCCSLCSTRVTCAI